LAKLQTARFTTICGLVKRSWPCLKSMVWLKRRSQRVVKRQVLPATSYWPGQKGFLLGPGGFDNANADCTISRKGKTVA
jgi:hypothetical protein